MLRGPYGRPRFRLWNIPSTTGSARFNVTPPRFQAGQQIRLVATGQRLGGEHTREGARLLVAGARGPGGFPPPVTDPRSRYRLWRWFEVERWIATHLGKEVESSDDDVLTAINASLELRRHGHRLHPSRQTMLRELAGL